MTRFPKNIEIGFRRLLIKLLRLAAGSRNSVITVTDFEHCKFLFVRQDRIGDVLVSTPLWWSLKRRYKNASIDILLSTNNSFVLENDPNIRRRWVYDKGISSSWRLIREIRRERYDFVIDLMDNPSATSTMFCLLSGARWTVGLEKENSYAYDVIVPLASRRDTHIVDRISRLLIPFGIDPSNENLRIHYVVSQKAREFARKAFAGNSLVPGTPIGVNISAGHEVRFWGIDNFRRLIALLNKKQHKLSFVVLSKPSQRDFADQIVQGFENVVLSPPTSTFDEFAALIEKMCLLITPDTSAVHLAAAFQVPSVVMYVQSDKNLRVWDPYKAPGEILVADVDDLRVIPPERVFEATLRMLPRLKQRRQRTHQVAMHP